jgi:hypothetical protein
MGLLDYGTGLNVLLALCCPEAEFIPHVTQPRHDAICHLVNFEDFHTVELTLVFQNKLLLSRVVKTCRNHVGAIQQTPKNKFICQIEQ